MNFNNVYYLELLLLLCWLPTQSLADVIPSSKITSSINHSFTSVGVLPYFRSNGDLYVALYRTTQKEESEYADITGTRQPKEKYIAQTAARIFFPLQEHKDIRTQTLDWPSQCYMAKCIFRGDAARGYLMTIGNERYTYILGIHRLSSLKELLSSPIAIVKVQDLLDAIQPSREREDFHSIKVIDSKGKTVSIQEEFVRGLAKGENWNFLQMLITSKE